jgi:putative oxidoreductase
LEGALSSDLGVALAAVGQLLLGGLFVVAGLRHFSIVPAVTAMIAARGVPLPNLTLLAGTVFQIAAGACLMLGVLVVPAAIGLVLFTLAASVMLLNFWDMQGEAREVAKSAFLANIAIIGGLLVTAGQAL